MLQVWTLHTGTVNRLEVCSWRWSSLGLGAVVVLLLLGFVSVLERLKMAAGIGFPQLPA